MKDFFLKRRDFFIKLFYFIGAIVLLGSIGIWFSISIDYLPDGVLTKETKDAIPGNILTYGLAILTVAIVDRCRWLIRNKFYDYRELEFLAIIPVFLGGLWLAYYSLHYSFKKDLEQANFYAKCTTLLAYILWWIASSKDSHIEPTNAMGGLIQP
jgi:hypothetical protein